jgi:hypothetical protein
MSAFQTIAAGAVVTTSGTTAAFPTPTTTSPNVGITVAATAVSGTSPSLTVTVEWSPDGTNFYAADPADSFAAITAAGGTVKNVTVKNPWYRLSYAVSGTTPSFTLNATAFFA